MKKQLNSNRFILCGKIEEIERTLKAYALLFEGWTVAELLDYLSKKEIKQGA